VKVSDAKQFIKNVAAKGLHIPVLLVGPMGVGKSGIVKQAAQELGMNLIDLRLAQQEPGDLIGIPRAEGNKTHWAKPEWWPQEGTRGILFLDELNRAPVDVRQAVFQLVNEWRMHTHKLPDGWYIVSAINPDNGNYQVETLDPAMLRRFCVIKTSADVETWLSWAKGPGQIDSPITGFIAAHRSLLATHEDMEIKVKPTPDQYRMLNTLMTGNVIMKEIEQEVFTGLIGSEAAVAFRRYLDSNYNRPVSGEDILENYSKVQKKVQKQNNAEMYITITDLSATLDNTKKLDKKMVSNLHDFVKDLSSEMKATFVMKIPTRLLGDLSLNREFTESIAEVLSQVKDKE
jgi:hypothetical protein